MYNDNHNDIYDNNNNSNDNNNNNKNIIYNNLPNVNATCHPYFSDFVHFFTICRQCWNDQYLKISPLNFLRFPSYWDLKIFCNSYFSSYPFILKFGMGEIFGARNPKITLRRLKNKQVLKELKISGSWYLWPDRCRKIHVGL